MPSRIESTEVSPSGGSLSVLRPLSNLLHLHTLIPLPLTPYYIFPLLSPPLPHLLFVVVTFLTIRTEQFPCSLYHTTPHSSLLTGKHSYHAVDYGNIPDSEFILNDGPMHSSWRSMISFGRVRKKEDRLEIAAILVFNHIYSNTFRWSDPGRLPLGLLQKWEKAGSGRPCRWRALAALRTVCQMAGVPLSVKTFLETGDLH